MKDNKSYSEKLRDPRWKNKRSEILERDVGVCVYCHGHLNKREKWQRYKEFGIHELQVHHKFYLPNLEPWEYENDALITLCETCHFYQDDAREKTFLFLPKEHIELARAMLLDGKYNTDVFQFFINEIRQCRFDTNKKIFDYVLHA